MKLSVSVPDELWQHAMICAGRRGASETVQSALRAFVAGSDTPRPMAHAPDPAHPERYGPLFEKAVEDMVAILTLVSDHGYRLGLLLAPGLSGQDFDALENPSVVEEVRDLLYEMGESDPATMSWEFGSHLNQTLRHLSADAEVRDEVVAAQLDELLGQVDDGAPGVRWESYPDIDSHGPRVSQAYAEAVVVALRDVRDEALRRFAQRDGSSGGILAEVTALASRPPEPRD